MLTFIKNHDCIVIRKKLFLLYLLNITDILFTLFLLGTGLFMEANSIMAGFISNPLKCIALKGFLPAVLLLYIAIRIGKANERQLKQANILLNSVITVYLAVNLLHIVWVLSIPIFRLIALS